MPAVSQISNFGELKDAIADTLDRTDIDTVIALWPTFVESDLNRNPDFRHWKMLTSVDLDIEDTVATVTVPSDFLEANNVEVDGTQIKYKPPDFIDMHRARYADTTEPTDPYYYSYRAGAFELWPTPSADGTLKVEYYQKIPEHTGDSDANWLLTLAPDVYFYGSLIHSAPYLRDDERIALFARLYDDAVAALGFESKQAMISGSRLRTTPAVTF